ncbi:uroporphyrinogen decarboxylase [bacterium]|nr:uroporphyrinogen decarboxylase [bacterium]
MSPLPDNWNTMTPDEKLDARIKNWISTEDKAFETPEAAKKYKERAQRYADVVRLKQPDRIPCTLSAGDYVAHYAGLTQGEMFYDYDKAAQAIIKFHEDFDLDYGSSSNFMPGKVFERFGYKLYRIPGASLSPTQSFQFVEGEYMQADEYDALITNPEGFLMRTYIPRVMGAMAGWNMMPNMLSATELPFVTFMSINFSIPPMQETLKTLSDVSQAISEWLAASGQVSAFTRGKLGLPATMGGFTKAPFDYLGDSLRGTRGIMMDLFRLPQKVLDAVERITPLAIEMGVNASNSSGNPFIMLPLHKGADGFISNKDFKKFYWPSLKNTLTGLIEEGVVPFLFVEGGYNQRLDTIANSGLPTGKTIWLFDKTDMAEAKKKIGGWAAIGGNIPVSLFKAGTTEEMSDYVKKLIDTCGPGGGFWLSPGAVLDQSKNENVHTYLKVGKEYGTY